MYERLLSIIQFLSGVFKYINDNKLIELGKHRERERNRAHLEEKKRIANEVRNDNVIDIRDRFKWLHNDADGE